MPVLLCTFHIKRAWLNFLLKHVRFHAGCCVQPPRSGLGTQYVLHHVVSVLR